MELFATETGTELFCLLCNKILSVGKKHNRKHYYDSHHNQTEKKFPPKSKKRKQELVKIKVALNVQNEHMKTFISESEMIQIATLIYTWILAREKKKKKGCRIIKATLLSAMEVLAFYLSEKGKENLTKRVMMLPMSRLMAARRIVDLSGNIEEQLKKELNSLVLHLMSPQT